MIYLNAIVHSKKEKVAEVKTLLQQLVVQSKQEEACIQYDLHQDLKEDHIFFFYEIWKDEEGLALHNQQTYLKEFALVINDLIEVPLTIYQAKLI